MKHLFIFGWLTVLLMVMSGARAEELQAQVQVRVASYNIHHGEGMDGKLDLERIANTLKQQRPDFVALQEVDNMATRSGKVHQAAKLAKLLNMKFAFGKSIALGNGEYGNAILSKHRIVKQLLHHLPSQGEARIALEIQCRVNGKMISFISVHLDHKNATIRVRQVQELERILSSRKHPIIMLGDFNATPRSPTITELAKTWSIVPKSGPPLTCPANHPSVEIDYLTLRGLPASSAKCHVGKESIASDHRPLFGTVKLPK